MRLCLHGYVVAGAFYNKQERKMEITQRKTADLIPYVNNARTHSEQQVLQIAASIKEFGFNNSFVNYNCQSLV